MGAMMGMNSMGMGGMGMNSMGMGMSGMGGMMGGRGGMMGGMGGRNGMNQFGNNNQNARNHRRFVQASRLALRYHQPLRQLAQLKFKVAWPEYPRRSRAPVAFKSRWKVVPLCCAAMWLRRPMSG